MALPRGQVGGAAQALGCACLLLSLLAQLPPGTQGLCYFQAQAPCHYKGKPFAPGESWHNANCSKCFCLEPLGVGCCDTMQPPVDFPEWCEVHYDSQACRASLVQKGQPGLPCANSLDPGWGSGHPPKRQQKSPLLPPPPPPPGKRGRKTPPGRWSSEGGEARTD